MEQVISNWWNRLTQWLVNAAALNESQPLVAWEASWDEAEALLASGKLWQESESAQARSAEAGNSASALLQQPQK